MDARHLVIAGLIALATPALAEPSPARARQIPTFGGAAQHYGDLRRSHRRATAAVTVPPGFFYGSGGVGGQPGYAQTYVFYGVTYPRARASTGVATNTTVYAVIPVQVRVDGH
jgi:hypothetical protein